MIYNKFGNPLVVLDGKERSMQFNKEMRIREALLAHPRAREIFIKHGMGCIACVAATMESIEIGALMHGVDVDAIVKDLNDLESIDDNKQSKNYS
ncbi:MAG: DUF1858 domain-containing protein [Actinomycetota bacterium]|nr:DUF1858 domain-containing protein [Actinomycetota bacterium]